MPANQMSKRFRLEFGRPLSRVSSEALTPNPIEKGESAIVVEIRDQSELHGLMRRIEDLGLELVSINPV